MRIPSLVTAAAAAAAVISSSLIASAPAHAIIRLADDPGGLIAAYQHRFERARATGERIVIDGSCLSACTLAVGLVPKEQICVTPKAVLGFHAAWTPAPWGKAVSGPATHHMYSIYWPELQAWINTRGGLTPHMIFLKGPELAAMVPACSEADIEAARAVRVAQHRPSRRMMARGPHFYRFYARPPMMMPMRMY
jgi:hypothetical protein